MPVNERPNALPPAEIRRTLDAPHGISKSLAKSLGCPTYFTGQQLQQETIGQSELHYLAKTGIDFHAWRMHYIEHLVTVGQSSDDEFRAYYLAREHLSEDCRTLIERDDFKVDPESVIGCEVFLSIDRDFRALEYETGRQPGLLSTHPNFLCSGTLDLILLVDNGRKVIIRDPKSGFSTVGVSDEEPPIYAALVFAHFAKVQEVEFIWDFVRVDAIKRSSYTRDDLPWIHQMIVELDAKKDGYVAQYNRGEALPANPTSGLCPYCQLTCPLRPRWEAGELAIGPVQTEEDFKRLAQLKKVCDDVSDRIAKVLLPYLDVSGGSKELGNGWEVAAVTSRKFEYPLLSTLERLGLMIVGTDGSTPSHSPSYDVPISSLKLSGVADFAKTKKSKPRPGGGGVSRDGMKDAIQSGARESSSTTLRIRKQQQVPIEHLMEESIHQLQK
jgi:hypothetical protein